MTLPISPYLIIIALSWLSFVIVDIYTRFCLKVGIKARKPLSCELCMGFWIGLIYFYFIQPINNFIIFAFITSLTAVILTKLVRW